MLVVDQKKYLLNNTVFKIKPQQVRNGRIQHFSDNNKAKKAA